MNSVFQALRWNSNFALEVVFPTKRKEGSARAPCGAPSQFARRTCFQQFKSDAERNGANFSSRARSFLIHQIFVYYQTPDRPPSGQLLVNKNIYKYYIYIYIYIPFDLYKTDKLVISCFCTVIKYLLNLDLSNICSQFVLLGHRRDDYYRRD